MPNTRLFYGSVICVREGRAYGVQFALLHYDIRLVESKLLIMGMLYFPVTSGFRDHRVKLGIIPDKIIDAYLEIRANQDTENDIDDLLDELEK